MKPLSNLSTHVAKWVSCMGVVGITVILGGCGSSEHQSDTRPLATVRFTVQPGTGATTLIEVAKKEGLFERNGIDAQLVPVANGPAAVTALASNSVDIAANAVEVFTPLIEDGTELKLIGGTIRAVSVFVGRPGLEVPDQFPESIRALKGKKLGVTALSSSTQYQMEAILQAAGVGSDDVKWVAYGSAGGPALIAGKVDTALVYGPSLLQSLAKGSKILVDFRKPASCPKGIHPCGGSQSGIWAKSAWIDRHPRELAGVRKALAESDAYIHDPMNDKKMTEVFRAEFGGGSDADFKLYKENALAALSAAYSKDSLEEWLQFDKEFGVTKRLLDVDDVFEVGTPQTVDDVKRLAAQ